MRTRKIELRFILSFLLLRILGRAEVFSSLKQPAPLHRSLEATSTSSQPFLCLLQLVHLKPPFKYCRPGRHSAPGKFTPHAILRAFEPTDPGSRYPDIDDLKSSTNGNSTIKLSARSPFSRTWILLCQRIATIARDNPKCGAGRSFYRKAPLRVEIYGEVWRSCSYEQPAGFNSFVSALEAQAVRKITQIKVLLTG